MERTAGVDTVLRLALALGQVRVPIKPNDAVVTTRLVPVAGFFTTMLPALSQVMTGAAARQSASQMDASGTMLLHWHVPVAVLKLPPLLPHTEVQYTEGSTHAPADERTWTRGGCRYGVR